MAGFPRGPLQLKPVCLGKVWSGEYLPYPLASRLNPPVGTGEIWLASDRHHVTPIAEGDCKGLGLDEVVRRWPEHILGQGRSGGVPLLIKLLLVGQWLSVQVHPDDDQARALEGEPWGKHEAWHVLEAAPQAQLIHGFAGGVDVGDVARAVAGKRISGLLARISVQAGETYDVPAGTVHAPGPGMVLYEIQQASDVTYRFYDWDRPDKNGELRPLHIESALKVLRITQPGEAELSQEISPFTLQKNLLVAGSHFSLFKWRVHHNLIAEVGGNGPSIIFILSGNGKFLFPGDPHSSWKVEVGQSWLLPAGEAFLKILADESGIVFMEAAINP